MGGSCLVCSSVIYTKNVKVGKLDTLFLLRILLEIPQENELIENINSSLNLIQICSPCDSTIKQCKQIYTLICEQIEKFWELQNKILESFSASSSTTLDNSKDKGKDSNDKYYNIWVNNCRKFVKEHDFTGFGYPFSVQDLETLLISCPPASRSPLNDDLPCSLKSEVAAASEYGNYDDDDSLPISEDPLHLLPSPLSEDAPNCPQSEDEDQNEVIIKEELESGNEDDSRGVEQDNCQSSEESISEEDSNDSDYKPSSSKKPRQIFHGTKRQSKNSNDGSIEDEDVVPKNISAVFTCDWPDCNEGKGKTFISKEFYDNHMDKHRKTPRKKCEQCGLLFYSKYQLTYHVKLEHIQGKRRQRLPTPGSVYALCRQSGLGAEETKEDPDFEATAEEKEDNSKDDDHDLQSNSEIKKRRGRGKNVTFKTKYEDIYNFVKDPTTNRFQCTWPDCSKSYVDRYDLVFHMDRHRGTPRHKCDKCPEAFYVKKVLDHHIQVVHEDGKMKKPFKCKTCGKSYSTKDSLYSHNTYSHSTKAAVWKICEICGKRMVRSALKKHVETVHEEKTPVRKFACYLCPMGFDREDRFKVHLLAKHQVCGSEEEMKEIEMKRKQVRETRGKLKCPKKRCFQIFVREENLRKHVEEKHGGSWEEGEVGEGQEVFRFRCGECGKGFHHKRKFRDHEETHKKREEKEGNWSFKCDKCGKAFPRNKQLLDHLQTHEEKEKSWWCEICVLGFVDEGRLERHRNTPQHKWRVERAGEMRRECDVCGKKFKSGRDVGVHKRHMHK